MRGKYIDWNTFEQAILKHYPYDVSGAPAEITRNTRVYELVNDVDDFIAVIFEEFTENVNLGNLEHNIEDDTLMGDVFFLI